MVVKKRNGELVKFDESKIKSAIEGAFDDCDFYKGEHNENVCEVLDLVIEEIEGRNSSTDQVITVEEIQDIVERTLMITGRYDVARAFIQYRFEHKKIREYVEEKERFINRYKRSGNTADATIDDNSNVSSKNIAIINNEIHKPENVETSRGLVMRKIRETHPDFDPKQYIRDLTNHWIYKHDESSMTPPPPYCVSETMYPFLISGIRGIGGLSAAPKNIDSFCGMYINMIFAVSSQFAGAVATPEFLMYFDYFARKEWGDDYYLNPDKIISCNTARQHTIGSQIHQYFQQVVYSINQPSAARGMQSAFVNFAYFDKPFFDGMFGHFVFPDGTQPKWDSLNWLQKNFMQWFNAERLKTMITFPVESFALVYKDGKFVDQENADFVAEEYARGHSFFTYISDTVDSLSSCCFEGSEVILVSDKKGNEFYTTIKDFVDSNDSSINEAGNKKMRKNYFIVSYNLDGKCEKTKITGTLKKEYNGVMYKIYTSENNYITVTPDHILMVKNKDGKIIDISAEELIKCADDYELVVA